MTAVAVDVDGPTDPIGARAVDGLVAVLGRQPVAALAFTWSVVLVVAAVLAASVTAAVAVLVVTWFALPGSRRAPGASTGSAVGAALRGVLVPVTALAVGLHLLRSPRGTVDDVLLLGAVAAVASGVAAAVRAARTRPPRVLVVGDLPQVRALAARWFDHNSVEVVGALAVGAPTDVAEAGLADLGIISVGTMDDIVAFLQDRPADLLVVASGPAVTGDDVGRLSWALEGSPTQLALISAVEHVAPHRLDTDVIAGSTMTIVSRPGATTTAAVVKAVTDRVVAAALLVAALPVLAVAAVVVRLDSPGRAIFRQTRVGRHGRLFTVYKLRTMTADAEVEKLALLDLDEGNGVLFKMRRDPRVTRVGHVLRTTSLDELPQLLNVIRGDMSLVGPRPALPEEVARYTELEQRRLVVKPGITGLWQVSGRSALSRERSMRLDASYADNWRPQGDAVILARTVEAVLSRRGAY